MKHIILFCLIALVLTIGDLRFVYKNINREKVVHTEYPPLLDIINWGPRSTVKNVRFNIQPNGMSAIWITIKTFTNKNDLIVHFGENKINPHDVSIQDEAITFLVPDELLQKVGRCQIEILEVKKGRKVFVGDFLITTK